MCIVPYVIFAFLDVILLEQHSRGHRTKTDDVKPGRASPRSCRAEGPLPCVRRDSQGLAPGDRPVFLVAQSSGSTCACPRVPGTATYLPYSTCISSTTQHGGPQGAVLTARIVTG